MRLFDTLPDAISEIERDLVKSPHVLSTRVQNEQVTKRAHEALGYSYSVPLSEIPETPCRLVELGSKYFGRPWNSNGIELKLFLDWLYMEDEDRYDEKEFPHDADHMHPLLGRFTEGDSFSYAYQERTSGMITAMVRALSADPDSRRVYWPIFEQHDSRRSALLTRIPCSLGYQALLRDIPGGKTQLHIVYLQRSCDFHSFWLSDIWFARRLADRLYGRLYGLRGNDVLGKLAMGQLTHFITSFHYFETGTEIF